MACFGKDVGSRVEFAAKTGLQSCTHGQEIFSPTQPAVGRRRNRYLGVSDDQLGTFSGM